MKNTRVRFYARGSACVPDYDALDDAQHPVRRMIGRRYQQVAPGQYGFAPTGQPQEVSLRMEVAQDAAKGLLWAADEETADLCAALSKCPVSYDPTLGGQLEPSSENA